MTGTQQLHITAVLELDAQLYPPDDHHAQQWLIEDILLGGIPDRLILVSREMGDEVGVLRIRSVQEPFPEDK